MNSQDIVQGDIPLRDLGPDSAAVDEGDIRVAGLIEIRVRNHVAQIGLPVPDDSDRVSFLVHNGRIIDHQIDGCPGDNFRQFIRQHAGFGANRVRSRILQIQECRGIDILIPGIQLG